MVKNLPATARDIKRCRFDSWVRKVLWQRAQPPTLVALAWRIPWTEEPGELQAMGLQRVGHD